MTITQFTTMNYVKREVHGINLPSAPFQAVGVEFMDKGVTRWHGVVVPSNASHTDVAEALHALADAVQLGSITAVPGHEDKAGLELFCDDLKGYRDFFPKQTP